MVERGWRETTKAGQALEVLEETNAAIGPGRIAFRIGFAGLSLTLDRSGAVFIDAERTLIVSDLHMEKGSRAGAAGRLIPALDSHDTMFRLRKIIDRYKPQRAICLGDSFHDRLAGERMMAADRQVLANICASVDEWVWITGNHDPDLPHFCAGESLPEFHIGGVVLRHMPLLSRCEAEIVGHFHPKTSVPAGGYRFSGRCFCVFEELLIMPAFGAYTGGLSCSDPAIRLLSAADPMIFMMHDEKLWRLA